MADKPAILDHPAYHQILTHYNDALKEKGKVNNSAFFRDVVSGLIPEMKYQTWNWFVKKFRTQAGILPTVQQLAPAPLGLTEQSLANTMLSNQEATQRGIQAALNIGMNSLAEILANPTILQAMPPEKRVDFLFKAMKAQDSRIHAIGKVKEDARQEEKFNRTFNGAAFEDQ